MTGRVRGGVQDERVHSVINLIILPTVLACTSADNTVLVFTAQEEQ